MTATVIKTKVVIVGAGPAGAATSFFLSKYRIDHVVVDKARFPRDKVCGDACSGKTALVINRANPDWLKEIQDHAADFMPSWGITFVAPNGKALDIPFHPDRKPDTNAPGFTVSRFHFDNFLFGKMASPYCTILEEADLQQIGRSGSDNTVDIIHQGLAKTIAAPLIVGCDGDKSAVRRHFMGATEDPKAYAVGLRAYYEGVKGLHPENFIELHFLEEVLPGYLWIFPMPHGRVNVGVGILSDVVRKKKINLRAQMMNAIQHNPAIAARFAGATMIGKIQGWGLPLANERQPISGEQFLLAGDAACLVDPFSGEGIGNAMYSGMLAAAAIKEAFDRSDFSKEFLRSAYDDVFFKRIGQELNISAKMQYLCNYRWLFNLVVNKAVKSASLRHSISSMFTDMDLREQLKKPSFYFKILMNR